MAEQLVIAAQLLDVAHVVGVLEQLRAERAPRDAPALPAGVLERHRAAQAADRLDVRLQQLQVQRGQEAGGLAQDRDDAGLGRDLCDARGGGARPQIGRGGLARELPRSGVREQRHVLVERLGAEARHRRRKARAHVRGEEP